MWKTLSQTWLSKNLLWIGMILMFSGCNSGSDKSEEQNALDKNIALWAQQDISDYQMNSRIFCFCPNSKAIVNIVEQSQISSAFVASSGEYLTNEALSYQKTVEGHFAVIQDAIKREAHSLVVSYHSTLGYPTSISIDFDELIADEEITYELSNFKQGIEDIEKPDLNLQLELKDQFEQISDVFLQGEIITFYLTVYNSGNQAAVMNFYNAQQFDFIISHPNGEEVWRWSEDMAFASVVTELVIEPGESVGFSISWDQQLPNEQSLSTGSYTIDGFIFDTNIKVQKDFSIE